MGTYYNPASDVTEGRVGRKLEDQGDTYASYTAQLAPGEALYLGTDNGSWEIVILLATEAEFLRTSRSRQGKGPYTYYAVPETASS